MAIHIDIYAHLREQKLIKEGEQLLRLIKHYEDAANQRAIKGAEGRSKKIVAANDKVETSYDHVINKIDAFTAATARLERAEASRTAVANRAIKTDEDAEKQAKDLANAERELAAAKQDLIYKGQALTKSVRDETSARADLNRETSDYTKNARAVTRLTNLNRKEFSKLARTTNQLRRETESLHTANIDLVEDNAKVTKGMRSLSDATKKTARERKKYNDLRKQEGVTAKQLEQQSLRVADAHQAEDRALQDMKASLVEVIEHRRDHDNIVRQNADSMKALFKEAGRHEAQADRLRVSNEKAIQQSLALKRQFDRISVATANAYRESKKYGEMADDNSVSAEALRTQLYRSRDAYVAHARAVENAKKSLADYDEQQRAAEIAKSKKDWQRIKPASIGQYAARNVGALTPLGTLSPSALIAVAGLLGTVGEAVVTASQSLALLPAAAGAAAAGIGTLTVGMWGFGDALKGMDDPKKFAEALYNLSPNAQQAALSIKNLVDGPLGDLKRATQDALFANVSPTLQKLAATIGPIIQRMTVSIAGSFNKMFTGISFQFMTPEMQERLGTITTNISAMFDRMIPGVLAFTSAFTKIAETGSGFLPQMADGFSRLMITFDNFITKAQEDGSLQNFMQKGIDAVAALSKWLLQFGQDVYKVFGNKSPQEFMKMLNTMKDLAIGLIEVFRGLAGVAESLLPVIKGIVSVLGGWENALWTIMGMGFAGWMWKAIKLVREFSGVVRAAAVSLGLIAPAAQGAAATTATAFAAGGATAGKGFVSKLGGVIKGFGWVGLGLTIAQLVGDGLRDGSGGWRDAIADGLDPGKILNPEYWIDKYAPGLRNPNAPSAAGGQPSPPNFYKDWYPAGDNPAIDIPGITNIPGIPDFPLPNVPLDENGKALTDAEILDRYRGQIPREQYAVDPFTDPITGQKITPMLPIGPNGMPEYPTGGTPGTPSIQGPVMPQYNAFGQLTGYGANMVDPEEVFDAQLAVQDRAGDLEEAKKDLLAAQQAGISSAEEINDLERKVADQKLALHKSLVQLGKAQTGDVEKLKKETDSARDAMGDFGAKIDADFGISKGLVGLAENLTKFIANLAFAPVFGAIRGAQAGLGFPNGEGAGSGLAGMAASSMGWYKGGPLDPDPERRAARSGTPGTPGYAPAYRTPGTPSSTPTAGQPSGMLSYLQAGGGPGNPGAGGLPNLRLNPNNVSTEGLKPQSMALLSLIQGMPQFANIPLTSAKKGREGDQYPWHGHGQGLDLGLDAYDPKQSALGDQLKAFLESNKELFGINNVLWKTMQGGNHFNHLHIGLNGSSVGKPDTSPLLQMLNGRVPLAGITPPGGVGGLGGLGSGIPIPLPVTIVGGSVSAPVPVAPVAPAAPAPIQPVPVRPAVPAFGPPLPPPPGTLQPTNLGGLLGSYANGGEVPIMAHSGEHVLTRKDVAAMGGQAAVYNFRRGLQSYDQGGAIEPTDLGGLLGVSSPTSSAPKPPAPPKPPPPPPVKFPEGVKDLGMYPPGPAGTTTSEVKDLGLYPEVAAALGEPPPAAPTPPQVAQVPDGVLPGGVETPGTTIGANVEAPAGYGEGLKLGGGILGAVQGAAMTAVQAAGMAGDMAGGMGGGSAGAAVASAAMQIGFEELNRAIEYAGQVAAIGAQGMLETFLPAGGSELAQNNWATRWLGGIAGAAPAIANLAGGANASNQGTLAGVGGPPTPEQVAAQGMDPNRTQHTGAGAPAGPYTGVNIQNYVVAQNEDRAGQDLARYQPAPGAR